jgi:protein O-GlcNAc transferase
MIGGIVTSDNEIILERAIELAKSGQLAESGALFLQAVSARPDDVVARKQYSTFLYQTGDTQGAIDQLQIICDADPGSVDAGSTLGAIAFSMDNLDVAEQAFERLLQHHPNVAEFQNNLGNVAFERGNFADAARYYRTAAQQKEDWWEPAFNLATALERTEDVEESLKNYRKAVSLAPEEAEPAIGLCRLLLQDDAFDEALVVITRFRTIGSATLDSELTYGRVLTAKEDFEAAKAFYISMLFAVPQSPEILSEFGAMLMAMEDWPGAIEKLIEALNCGADEIQTLLNLGQSYLVDDRLESALEAFMRVNTQAPDNIEAMKYIATTFKAIGRLEEAITWYRRVLDIQTGNTEIWTNLATTCLTSRLYEDAENAARYAIEIDPGYPEAHHALACLFQNRSRYREAMESCERALELNPEYVSCLVTKGTIHLSFHDSQAALDCAVQALNLEPENELVMRYATRMYRQAQLPREALRIAMRYLALYPKSVEMMSAVVDIILNTCEWRSLDKVVDLLIGGVRKRLEKSEPIGVCVNNLQALPISYPFLVEAGENVSLNMVKSLAKDLANTNFDISAGRYKGDKIRIGYLLPYVRFHSMPMMIREVVRRHDRSIFEVFGYCITNPEDTEFSNSFVSSFQDFSWSMDQQELASKINADGIELLIDCTGHTEATALDVAALKPAPVNIHSLGYSVSMGADFMDYVISDECYIPDKFKDLGPEKIIYLPDTMMPTTRSDISTEVSSRTKEGLPEKGIVFCNFNQPFKIEARIFDCWMTILKSVPDSVLWLGNWNPTAKANLQSVAVEAGIDPDRLVFGDLIGHSDHLARLALADLALDTFYHGGGVTTVDCLWAGLPVLSIRGETPSRCLGETILTAHGMSDLVVDSFEEYVQLAIDYAGDAEKLATLRKRCWDNRDTEALFDPARYCRNLDQGLLEASRKFRAGLPPDHITV